MGLVIVFSFKELLLGDSDIIAQDNSDIMKWMMWFKIN